MAALLDASIHQNKSGENMRQAALRTAGAMAVTFLMACRAYSQTQTLNIWPGTAPGSENWTHKEKTVDNTPIGTVVFNNVVTPTLTIYLPERTKTTGTGVIIAPGGAFLALAIDLEGFNVARWLQEKGIAAFVLKYPTAQFSSLLPRQVRYL